MACWKTLNFLDDFPKKTPADDSPARALQTPDPLDSWPKQCHYVSGSMAVGRVGTGGFLSWEDMGGHGRTTWKVLGELENTSFWLKVMMFSTKRAAVLVPCKQVEQCSYSVVQSSIRNPWGETLGGRILP